MNILLLASHAVAEYDDLRMFTDLGYDCFAPGGYERPWASGEGIRPALPDAPPHPELVERLNEVRAERGEPGPAIDWGKAALHDDIIDWADVIIVHHFPVVWIGGQWDRIKHKRVIWRTCGQSDPSTEAFMTQFTGSHGGLNPNGGLQIVRYSPAEERHFTRLNAGRLGVTTAWAGQDALIRFGKYPADYGPWTGDNLSVGNITQHMAQRGDACGAGFWLAATEGLPARPAGPGSEALPGGVGPLPYDGMLEYLRRCRAYLYTGTRPASYTLGLIEAMLSGTPVVTIPADVWGEGWDGEDLFESREIVRFGADTAAGTRQMLADLLRYDERAAHHSKLMRQRAEALFGVTVVGAQWKAFLS